MLRVTDNIIFTELSRSVMRAKSRQLEAQRHATAKQQAHAEGGHRAWHSEHDRLIDGDAQLLPDRVAAARAELRQVDHRDLVDRVDVEGGGEGAAPVVEPAVHHDVRGRRVEH